MAASPVTAVRSLGGLLEETQQQAQDFGLDGDRLRASAQFEAFRVQRELSEAVTHADSCIASTSPGVMLARSEFQT